MFVRKGAKKKKETRLAPKNTFLYYLAFYFHVENNSASGRGQQKHLAKPLYYENLPP
jgi:hypothetical protein